MNCDICNDVIRYGGIIENGRPYHHLCYKDREAKKNKELFENSYSIEGIDDWLVTFFKENPTYAKCAVENRYFAIMRVSEQNACSSSVYSTEMADTFEKFENELKDRVIYDRSDDYVYSIEYLIVDKKVVKNYSIGTRLTIDN